MAVPGNFIKLCSVAVRHDSPDINCHKPEPMKKFLTLDAWKMFLILSASIVLMMLNEIFALLTGSFSDSALTAMLSVTGALVYFLWMLFLGLELNRCSGTFFKFRKSTYILAVTIVVLRYVSTDIGTVFKTGMPVIPGAGFLLSLLALLGIAYIVFSLSRSIKSARLKRNVDFRECIPEALYLLFVPAGIWVLQPGIKSYLGK